jgi:serine/threonine-protein kinase
MTDGHTRRLESALAGRYKIQRKLGEGGMASVYLAEDIKHDRKVALKVLRPELAAVIGGDRFLNEIRLTANLQHPHILPLHDSGDADGFLFYVMPFVEDDTLRDKLDREKQLPVDEAVAISRSIASALDYAHRQGVIHRDIKPANILMHEGQPMIADFGIALAVSEASGQRLTETGLSIGTPHYMSPEQAMGDRELDARSDVYSLGAMLYEMLAGEPPYSGTTAQAIVAKVITTKASPLRESRDTVPLHVEAAVARALQKSPADRFSSAASLAEALANPGFTTPATAQVPLGEVAAAAGKASSRRPLILATAAALVALGAGLFIGRSLAPSPTARVAQFGVDAMEGVQVVGACCGPQQALSPDGEWLVYRGQLLGAQGTSSMLFRRRLGQLVSEEISNTEGASEPFFSPDGLWVGFYADGRLRKVPMGGGPPVTIAEIDLMAGASWGDNDVIVYATSNDGGLFTVPATGGAPVQVPMVEDGLAVHPSVLPGGTAVVAGISRGSAEDIRVGVVDLETGTVDTLGVATRVAYAAGHLILSGADGTLLVQRFDPDAREALGPAVAILDGIGLSGPGRMGSFAVSQAGDLVYRSTSVTGDERLMILGPDGPAAIPLAEQGNLEGVAFSPDGRRVSMQIQESGIWIWDRDQITHELLVPDGRSAVWTPDGQSIAFARGEDATIVEWMPADGSGSPEVLLDLEHFVAPSSFSPDGTVLALRANPDSDRDIGFLKMADGEIRWFVEDDADETQPIISPDGRWVAYTSDRSRQLEVYVRAFDGSGGRTQISLGGGHSPRWHPSGDTIYYAFAAFQPTTAVAVAAEDQLRVLDRSQGVTGIVDLNVRAEVNWDVGPDGDEFLFIGREQDAEDELPSLIWVLNWPELARTLGGGS